jgi:hypothetical protein
LDRTGTIVPDSDEIRILVARNRQQYRYTEYGVNISVILLLFFVAVTTYNTIVLQHAVLTVKSFKRDTVVLANEETPHHVIVEDY